MLFFETFLYAHETIRKLLLPCTCKTLAQVSAFLHSRGIHAGSPRLRFFIECVAFENVTKYCHHHGVIYACCCAHPRCCFCFCVAFCCCWCICCRSCVVRPLSRHSESLTAANWVYFDLNVSYCSCRGYSLINPTLELKCMLVSHPQSFYPTC